ncbi:unnamed protein product [Closterium sp. NIES-64]|nr:unnamed protein product [Closterium sp. NIES-64]
MKLYTTPYESTPISSHPSRSYLIAPFPHISRHTQRSEEAGSKFEGLAAEIEALVAAQEADLTVSTIYAAWTGDMAQLQQLLAAGAKADRADYDGRTPLHLAAAGGHNDLVRLLLLEGAQVNAVDNFGTTPLLEALRAGHDEAAAILASKGGTVGLQEAGPVLCAAVAAADTDLLQRLLSHGVHPNASDYDQRSPLHIAAIKGHLHVARLLVDHHADVAARDSQPSVPSTQSTDPSASTSEAQWLEEDSTHVVFKHFKVPVRPDTIGTVRVSKYCAIEFKGGAFRCAQHLAKWKGQRSRDVRLCAKVSPDVRAAVRAHYENKASNRDEKRRAEDAALNAVAGGAKRGRIADFIGDGAQCKKGEADYAVCLFFAGCRIPEHHADNPLWRNMVSAINNAPHGYVAPRRKYVGGAGLKQCRTSIEMGLQPIAASWKRDGVTVSSDLMTDRCGRPQANVMLVNDSGAVFVEAIDCNMESKTGGYIASILRPIIEKVGPENVVALCMDGGSNYGAACKELMADWPHIEYVPCATHVLDLLMEDVGKISWCKDIVDLCGDTITYVRNHHFTRNHLRSKKVKKGKGKQLVKPAGTRFGTNYIALSRLVELRSTLSQMVLSEEFANWSAGARKQTADTFRGQIMDDAWWKNATYLAELLAIPFKVMRATDSSAKGMMGTIYDLMLQLTEDVNDKLEAGEKILPRAVATDIGKIVRRHWDESLACALHVVGRILNPANQEEGIFRNDMECTRIFKAFIARHYDGKTFTNKDVRQLLTEELVVGRERGGVVEGLSRDRS